MPKCFPLWSVYAIGKIVFSFNFACLSKQPSNNKIYINTKIYLRLSYEICIGRDLVGQPSSCWIWWNLLSWRNDTIIFQRFQCYANPLRFIHPAAFKGVLALRFIFIDSRQLQQLPPLQDITHSLICLYLVSMGMGQTKNEHYFRGCRTLEQFGMTFSVLQSISLGLCHIGQTFKYLKFDHNGIRSVASMKDIAFTNLRVLDLSHNNITHFNTEHLDTPQLRLLRLQHNHLVSLRDVILSSWGGKSLPDGVFLDINLHGNPWNCDGSLAWLQSNLFILARNMLGEEEIIYPKPPLRPRIGNVGRLICHSPDKRLGTAVVPHGRIAVHRRIKSLKNLAGNRKWHR